MLHAKFKDQRTSGSGEEYFNVFTIYWCGGHLGDGTWTIFPLPKEAPREI